MNRWISLALAFIFVSTSCTTNPAETQKTAELSVREQLEEMAKELVYFSANNFVFGRTVSIKPNRHLRELEALSEYEKELPVILTQEVADQYHETSKRIVRKLSTHRWNATDLITLLDHPNAKVRTLAAAALIATDNPKNVPPLAKLLRDDSPTFPSPPYLQESAHHTHGELYRQTVAHAVIQLVRPYMPDTFMIDALLNRTPNIVADFKSHFSTREGPAAICKDFEIWRMRACGDATDSLEEYNERLERIRERLINIPMPDRAWYAMAIGNSYSDIYQRQQQLLSDESIAELARNVGHEQLIRAVAQQIESTEMFLQPVPSGSPRRKFQEHRLRTIRDFILCNAKELLKPDDSDQLLTLATKAKSNDDGMSFSNFTFAAADLQPDRAIQILHDGFAVLQEIHSNRNSQQMAIALWKYGGMSQRDFLVDWFYFEIGISPMRITAMPHFLVQADEIADPDGRILVVSIIKDARLQNLNWIMTKWLVGIVNRRLTPPWFKPTDGMPQETDLNAVESDPTHHDHQRDGTKSTQITKSTLDPTAQWHARLRERISEYEQAKR